MNLAEMKGSKFSYLGARAKKKLAAKELKRSGKQSKGGVVAVKAKGDLKLSNKKVRSQQGIMSIMQKINESQAIIELKDIELGGGVGGDTDIDKLSIAEENNSDRGKRIIDPMSQPAKVELPLQLDPMASVPPPIEVMAATHKKEDD
jgi:hypothetical protein